MRLFFFPALAPLAGVLPWLLTAVGVAAGAARALSRSKRVKKLAWPVAVALFVAGGTLAAWPAVRTLWFGDSALVGRAQLPKLTRLDDAPAAAAPAPTAPGKRDLLGESYSVIPTRAPMSGVVAAASLLLYATRDGTLEAHELATGKPRWRLELGEPSIASPVVDGDGRVAYVATGLHTTAVSTLTAIELESGRVAWVRRFSGHLEDPPALDPAGKLLFQGAGPAGLWALDRRTGQAAWSRALGHVDSTPLRAGARLFVPALVDDSKPETRLFALDAESGRTEWQTTLPGQPWGAPLLSPHDPDHLLIATGIGNYAPSGLEARASDRGWAHSVSLATGAVAWSVKLAGLPLMRSVTVGAAGRPDLGEALVIHTLCTGAIVALRASDGRLAWQANARAETIAPSVLVPRDEATGGPWLVTIATDGRATVREARTGRELQRIDMAPQSTSSPAFADGVLYLASPALISAFRVL